LTSKTGHEGAILFSNLGGEENDRPPFLRRKGGDFLSEEGEGARPLSCSMWGGEKKDERRGLIVIKGGSFFSTALKMGGRKGKGFVIRGRRFYFDN